MVAQNSVRDLLGDEIKNLYSAEMQLIKAIPKMAKRAGTPALRIALKAHLGETLEQVKRLEKSAKLLGIKLTGEKFAGTDGGVGEGAEALGQKGEGAILDLGIIGAGTRVEHYEMAAYMTAIALAQRLGASEVASLLKQSLAEEEAAAGKLRNIADGMLKTAHSKASAFLQMGSWKYRCFEANGSLLIGTARIPMSLGPSISPHSHLPFNPLRCTGRKPAK